MSRWYRERSGRGLSLVEVLVVVAIIAVLAAMIFWVGHAIWKVVNGWR